jgi:hypothetical protein
MKSRLAEALHVPLPRISDWLAGNYLPSGERALKLAQWVSQQQAKQTTSPGGAQTPPRPKTQSKASNEKKPQSGRKKQ